MKIIILVLFVISSAFYGQSKDSTLKIDLNFDREEETVSFRFNYDQMNFTLRINNAEVTETFNDSYDADIEIIDMNRNDNLKEVLVKGYGMSDQSDMHFYQFINGKIVKCGHLPSNFGIEVKGNNRITEYAWMGFWSAKIRYEFDSQNKTLTKIEDEFYEVNQECEVVNPFKLLLKRDDNSEAVVTLKPKTKLTIIKADISPVHKFEDGTYDDWLWDWYLFKTPDGKQGWCRLKDFQENVDGLIWAG